MRHGTEWGEVGYLSPEGAIAGHKRACRNNPDCPREAIIVTVGTPTSTDTLEYGWFRDTSIPLSVHTLLYPQNRQHGTSHQEDPWTSTTTSSPARTAGNAPTPARSGPKRSPAPATTAPTTPPTAAPTATTGTSGTSAPPSSTAP